ncbi:MAG: hypothetical protein WAU02_01155 [Candidatus Saccharimonadales bacterium]
MSTSSPQPPRRIAKPLKIAGFVILALLYTAGTLAAGAWWRDTSVKNAANAIDPRKVVQESLVKNLDLKTVKRHITYRDNADRGMLVDWDLTSDFSNPRDPRTKGFLTLTWLRDKTEYKQKLEMVILVAESYTNVGYFRMVEGAELTKAPTEWVKVDFSSYSSDSNGGKLYERAGGYNRDTRAVVYRSIFDNTPYNDSMKNFHGFDIARFTSPAFYMVMGTMRSGNDKSNLADMIRANRPYVMQNCQKSETEAWCDGQTNSGEMQAVSAKYYESEGMGGNNLTFDPIYYVMVSDLKTGWLKKFQINAQYGSDSFVTQFSGYNEPVEINAPI